VDRFVRLATAACASAETSIRSTAAARTVTALLLLFAQQLHAGMNASTLLRSINISTPFHAHSPVAPLQAWT
jgi:hypothetical protein